MSGEWWGSQAATEVNKKGGLQLTAFTPCVCMGRAVTACHELRLLVWLCSPWLQRGRSLTPQRWAMFVIFALRSARQGADLHMWAEILSPSNLFLNCCRPYLMAFCCLLGRLGKIHQLTKEGFLCWVKVNQGAWHILPLWKRKAVPMLTKDLFAFLHLAWYVFFFEAY